MRFLPEAVVIACCVISIGLSVIGSRINTEEHHWGLMYISAAYLNDGLVPYKEIFIMYGFLTTLIQSLALRILGNTVVSLGVVTGLFYAASIYLSYALLQKILDRWLAALSAAIIFLIHPYIILPWANYFSYTFLLAFLLVMVTPPETGARYFCAGVLLAFSLLARQSNLLSILIPVYLYFIFRLSASAAGIGKTKKIHLAMLHFGLFSVAVVFVFYLFINSAIRDWLIQSLRTGRYYIGSLHALTKMTARYVYRLLGARPVDNIHDARAWLYTVALFNNFIICRRIFLDSLRRQLGEKELILFLLASAALFEYLESFHLYEIFRLQNASSLGIGLLVFTLYGFSKRLKKGKRLAFNIPVFMLIISLVFAALSGKTSLIYFPWHKDFLLNKRLSAPKNIDILRGKLYDSDLRAYYENLHRVLEGYRGKLDYLVNFTWSTYTPFLSAYYKKPQKAPYYVEGLSELMFPGEQRLISGLLSREEALLVTPNPEWIPINYRTVLALKNPGIEYINSIIYIAVPRRLNRLPEVK